MGTLRWEKERAELAARDGQVMSKPAPFKFRLYVAGDSPSSTHAIANLKALCREHLPGRHEIEIVDVFREPERALTDGVVLTHMLMKLSPVPMRKIVG